MDIIVSTNERVKVKLNDKGKAILNERNARTTLELRAKGIRVSKFKIKVDKDGYTRFQIWQFMQIFGEHMKLGAEFPFDSEIIVLNGREIK